MSSSPPSKANLTGKDSAPNFPAFHPDYSQPETFAQKIVRKTAENPFVPIGLGATIAALTMGLISMVRGDTKRSQFMMRARVGAQGFTVATIFAGVMYQSSKTKKRESEGGKKVGGGVEEKDDFLDKINKLETNDDYLASIRKK